MILTVRKGNKMTQEEKINELAELFEVDACVLELKTPLDSLNWDSMARMALIGLVKEKFDRKLPVDTLRQLKTIGDILEVMEV